MGDDVGGAYFVIVANRSESFITNNVFFQKIGLWSYSIYLWHWPLVVLFVNFALDEKWKYIFFISSFVLGWLSYLSIESINRHVGKLTFLLFCIPAIIFGVLTNLGDGFPNRFEELNKSTFVDKEYNDSYVWDKMTKLNSLKSFSKKKNVIVIGDSQSGDLVNSLLEEPSINLLTRTVWTECGIPYLDKEERKDLFSNNVMLINRPELAPACDNLMDRLIDIELLSDADAIYIAYLWHDEYLPYLGVFIDKLKTMTDAEIIIFGRKDILYKSSVDIVKLNGNTSNLGQFSTKFKNLDTLNINLKIKEISEKHNSLFFDYSSIICPTDDNCLVLDEDYNPIFYDPAHVSPHGAKYLSSVIIEKSHALTLL